ncbi:MAG TPA: UDP-glucose 4-epimerase GalE [Geminicoccaceae bacterium]
MRQEAPWVLVAGGAGYIGSHVVKQLILAGYRVVVYDNLSTGFACAVPGAELVVADLSDRNRLDEVLLRRRFAAVLHFAASIWVGESVREPARYYRNNVANALNLFEAAAAGGVGAVVFSSTAAVYGEPEVELIDEAMPLAPINPYGASKMMAERMLQDVAAAAGMRTLILRYFNVAGAALDGSIGEATPNNSHLVKVACETAMGLRPGMQINGTDYPTPDGTCVRDYIHVQDLADAHVAALDHLLAGGGADAILNCGYGHGLSVREVLEAVRRISGVRFEISEGPRRAGDPPRLVAANRRIQDVLAWRPRYDDLDLIVGTAWRFEQKLQAAGRASPA